MGTAPLFDEVSLYGETSTKVSQTKSSGISFPLSAAGVVSFGSTATKTALLFVDRETLCKIKTYATIISAQDQTCSYHKFH